MQSLNQLLGQGFSVHNSPLNTSKTKQQYSFSKANRFNNAHKSLCGSAFYFLPSTLNKRTTSFGIGTKGLKQQRNNTPSPTAYQNELINSIQNNIQKIPGQAHVRGFSFGSSRDQMKNSGIYKRVKNGNPGPGQYDLRSTLNKMSYSMRPKTPKPTSKEKVPGPGTYQPPNSIQKFGRYFISKFISSGATIFNPPTSKRFNTQPERSPGPATYNPQCQQMANDGNYFISKYPSTLCRSFPKLKRLLGIHYKYNNTPGPGAYRAVSEFGYYQSEQQEFYNTKKSFKFDVPQKKSRPQTAGSKIPSKYDEQLQNFVSKISSQNYQSGTDIYVPIFK